MISVALNVKNQRHEIIIKTEFQIVDVPFLILLSVYNISSVINNGINLVLIF